MRATISPSKVFISFLISNLLLSLKRCPRSRCSVTSLVQSVLLHARHSSTGSPSTEEDYDPSVSPHTRAGRRRLPVQLLYVSGSRSQTDRQMLKGKSVSRADELWSDLRLQISEGRSCSRSRFALVVLY